MRRLWLVGTVFITLLFLYSYSSHAQGVQGPKIFVEERVFDFMEVKEGEVIEHTFHVHNLGDEILEIKKVAPG